jgi:amidase
MLWQIFRDIDVLITPMLSGAPLPLGSFPMNHSDVDMQWRKMNEFAPYAALANISGFPALSLPFGEDADGMPIAVQLIAPMGADRLLLNAGQRLEDDGRWQHKFPVAGLNQ